jgi:hypothetical protein
MRAVSSCVLATSGIGLLTDGADRAATSFERLAELFNSLSSARSSLRQYLLVEIDQLT